MIFFLVITFSAVLECGSITFSATGVTIVEIIRKNSSRKNMMSFNDAVYTSASLVFLRSIFIGYGLTA